jgi:hypothetical protein
MAEMSFMDANYTHLCKDVIPLDSARFSAANSRRHLVIAVFCLTWRIFKVVRWRQTFYVARVTVYKTPCNESGLEVNKNIINRTRNNGLYELIQKKKLTALWVHNRVAVKQWTKSPRKMIFLSAVTLEADGLPDSWCK